MMENLNLDPEKLLKNVWKIILIWFALVIIVFSINGGWSLVAFEISFGLIVGGIAYRFRNRVRPFFHKIQMNTYFGFLLLSIFVTVIEEIWCYGLGNKIAYPVLWIDLILVSMMWSVWFGSWYFFLAKRYVFSEKEALLTAASTGVLYEYIGTGAFLSHPLGFLFAIPFAIVIYAAIFVLPMQLINFTGTNNHKVKYLIGIILPFILTLPIAILSIVVLSI